MKKLDYVDTLRCLAILGVIMVHTDNFVQSNLSHGISQIISLGAKGVQLFFIASAFTLYLSFEKRLTKENYPVKNFFTRRIFRIAPMYYLAIVYYLIQYAIVNREASAKVFDITTSTIIANFTFTHGFNPYWINNLVPGGWSIAVEMTFYAVMPFIFSRIKNINQAFNLFTGSLVFSFLLNLLFTHYPLISSQTVWADFLYFYFPNQFPVFCLGMIMYFIIIKGQGIKKISRLSFLVFGICVLVPFLFFRQTILTVNFFVGVGFLFFAIFLSKRRIPLLVNPVTQYIGIRSFSMYLVHFAVIFWLTQLNFVNYVQNPILNYVIRFLLVTGFSVILSTVFYALIEVPFQNLGKKLIDTWENNPRFKNKSAQNNTEEKLVERQF